MQTFLAKYGAAVYDILTVVVAAFLAVLDKPITLVVAIQLGIVTLKAITTYLLPLMNKTWQAGWKVSAAIVLTILTGLVPYLMQGTLTGQNILMLAFSAIGVLAAQLGVNHRIDAAAVTPQPNLDSGEPADAAAPAAVPEATTAPALS